MAQDHDEHDDHDHHHHHHHDHHHHHGDGHGHDHHHDHHDWQSQGYVRDWIARDARRQSERQPIIERLIAAVPFARDAPMDVIDVGAGAGLVTEAILEAFPNARVTLQDYSQPMLDRARERLGERSGHIRYALCDLRDPAWANGVGGPFELAVSAIAIHNLREMAAIAACYGAVHGLMKAGGCFLDYDHFDRVGGVPLHQHMLKVAGFSSAQAVWHEHPTAILKAGV